MDALLTLPFERPQSVAEEAWRNLDVALTAVAKQMNAKGAA